jgi:hypothetical protein
MEVGAKRCVLWVGADGVEMVGECGEEMVVG